MTALNETYNELISGLNNQINSLTKECEKKGEIETQSIFKQLGRIKTINFHPEGVNLQYNFEFPSSHKDFKIIGAAPGQVLQ
jgi:hypothetical protein